MNRHNSTFVDSTFGFGLENGNFHIFYFEAETLNKNGFFTSSQDACSVKVIEDLRHKAHRGPQVRRLNPNL